MTDVRVTGIAREVHRDGPGTLRLTQVAREVHRTPTFVATRVRAVSLAREVHINGIVDTGYPRILVF